jgi:hypothetical protein
MALSTYLYSRSIGNGKGTIGGVRHMLYTTDPVLAPSDTEAERKALALAQLASDTGLSFPPDYFDQSEQLIGASAGGVIALDGENIIIQDGEKTTNT